MMLAGISVRKVFVLIAVGAALALGGCDGGRGKAQPSITDPIVAATVDGKPIYVSDVDSLAVVRGFIREGQELDPNSDAFFQLLEDLIETRLFAAEAEARQLDRNADVRHRLERSRELILAEALNEQLRETAIDESAIEKMYRDQIRILRNSREVHARRIVLPTRDSATAVARRLESGETFEALAYELSIDRATAAEGGDMGFVIPEQMPESLRVAISETPVGRIAGPLQTDLGWTLVRVEERREEAPPSIAILRPQIEEWLLFQEQRRLVDRLKSDARIERLVEERRGFDPNGDLTAPGDDSSSSERRPTDPAVPLGPSAVAGAAAPAPQVQFEMAPEPEVEPAPQAAPRPARKQTPRPRAEPPLVVEEVLPPPAEAPTIYSPSAPTGVAIDDTET
jgi:peptidyl-prolyl cis-trans isomerase C